ncbi:unnamed protein product, partial [Schistosoma turkestanicum]
LLQGLQVAQSSLSNNARCVNVVFTPIVLIIRQKRQIVTTETTDQNVTQGVQGTANVEISSPEAALLNATSFTDIISSGVSQLNNSNLQLSNIETAS